MVKVSKFLILILLAPIPINHVFANQIMGYRNDLRKL